MPFRRVLFFQVHGIKKSTRKMQLHLDIKNVLVSKNLEGNEGLSRLKGDQERNEEMVKEQVEVYSHIPTISSVRSRYHEFNEDWPDQNNVGNGYDSVVMSINNLTGDSNMLIHNKSLLLSCEAQDVMDSSYPISNDEKYVNMYNSNESPVMNPEELKNVCNNGGYISQNLVPLVPGSEEINNSNENEVVEGNAQEIDPISRSRNQLQKSVEKSLQALQQVKSHQKDEKDRALIARILENDVDEDYYQYDSLSDNCDEVTGMANEVEERHDSLLAERLEEMRQLFGMDDDEEEKEKAQKDFLVNSEVEMRRFDRKRKIQKHNNIWYHERVIQMYKMCLLGSEMTTNMKERNRSWFLELFGDDSDEENEIHFRQEDKYLTSCKERISSWVVKYLMPFYNKKRIIGRNVFKSLGYHVSNSIIQQIQYPDEWTVKYFVTKFFPSHIRFTNESDVTYFQIE